MWVRRVLTIPLGVLVFVLLFVALVTLEISDTFLDPGYYPRELRKASIYEFVMVDLTTSAINEARQLNGEALPEGFDGNPLVNLGLSTEDVVTSLNTAIPPAWLQDLVEQVFDELGRYVTGERDEFAVSVQAGEQAVKMVSEVKRLLGKADAYNLLYEEFVTPAVDDVLYENLPLGLHITNEQLVRSVRNVAPPECIQTQVEAALDEVTPYLMGERDSFEIRVQLADTIDRALQEVKLLLRETDAYELLYDDVIRPVVAANLGETVELPLGIALTNEEVLSSLRKVAPPEWVQEQTEMVIDNAGPYLAGQADSFAIPLSLAANKGMARDVIAEIASSKLQQAAAGLPECTASQAGQISLGGLLALPACLPQGLSADELANQVGAAIGGAVDSFILAAIPDDVIFTNSFLRESLIQAGAGENIELLDRFRQLVRDGWTYTDRDLRRGISEAWGDEGLQGLDDLRAFLANGWTYTHKDLREDLAQAGDANTLKDFDRARNIFSRARTLRLLVYLPVILVLVAIGFLGGTRWPNRVAWAAGSLALTAGIIFLVSGPVYNAVGKPRIERAAETAISEVHLNGDFQETQRLATDKIDEIVRSAVNGFASGIALKSSFLFVIGLIALVVSLNWHTIKEFIQLP